MVKPKKVRAKVETRGRPTLSGEAIEGERSPFVGLRLPASDIREIDALAEQEGVNRSEMVRRLIDAGREAYRSR